MAGSASSAAFIGAGELLVACAETWTRSGGAIHGVVSDCPIVSAWCNRAGVARIAPKEDQAGWLARAPFDYLFSIVNHAITPAAVLALPKRRAINYHDSPLPRYAGFNATSWAIIGGETSHGVTWHQMTADVDGGDILVQQSFDIRDDDTAFTVGAACVDAGRRSFEQLVAILKAEAESGQPAPVIRQGPRQFFHLRSDRPGLGVLDFNRTTLSLRNLVRALDLGSDDNWMCRPKLALPGGYLVAGRTERGFGRGEPGEVLAVDGASLTIGTSDGALRFLDLKTLDNAPASPADVGAKVGQIARSRDAGSEEAVTLDAAASRQERFWVQRLATSRAPVLGDVMPNASRFDPASLFQDLPEGETSASMIAALIAYIARVGEGEGFDLSLVKDLPAQLAATYAPTAPLRVEVDLGQSFEQLTARVADELQQQQKRGWHPRDIVSRYGALRGRDIPRLPVAVQLHTQAAVPTLADGVSILLAPHEGRLAWVYDSGAISQEAMTAISQRIATLLASARANPARPVGKLDMLPPDERKLILGDWQDTKAAYADAKCVHDLFAARVAQHPDDVAVVFNDAQLTYAQLDERSNRVAAALKARGVGPDKLVGVRIQRSLDLIVGLMGVLKAGGAYVPLDPAYPRERVAMMLEDSKAGVLLTQRSIAGELNPGDAQLLNIEDALAHPAQPIVGGATPDSLAYVMFTSGSTGRPKGVMVRHLNVSNFFTGMDQRIGTDRGVWLAVTSMSFDISVLELFWTLARGFKVVIQGESDRASLARQVVSARPEPMAFSLFYFAAGQGEGSPYRLMLEGAKFADEHDFSAVWTPERHFHEFGGPYPNPAVTTAALAAITKRVSLRAGSVVLPLHNPLRVAEDWAVVDQISGGRVGLSFASGWHADDFAFMPQNYERRREVMLESIETVLKLWRGEKIDTVNGQGKTISVRVLPRPVQAAPPMWIASAGSIDTFKAAGKLGANVLTNMLGQDIGDLRNKFAAYRDARRAAGHLGDGIISVMLHTFVCESTEKARELARTPFANYLKSSFDLIKMAPSMFPAFRQPSLGEGEAKLDPASFNDDDMAALLDHAFDRYFETAGLFGSPERALEMVDRLKSIGANEVACLVDFGVDVDQVLDSLPYLDRLRQIANAQPQAANDADYSIAAQIRNHGVTHLQCTPSMARMIASDADGVAALSGLKRLMVGGEALPADLADQLTAAVTGEIHNMYGPTETTIWSTTSRVIAGQPVTIGTPIANTIIRILDKQGNAAPIGVAGELCIGGDGVARGYWGRDDLTAERFVADPYGEGLIYRTGDLARYKANGDIDFLGRLDHQVKVNGYRIELGEIEGVLGRHAGVGQAVVVARSDNGPAKLVAYVVPAAKDAATDAERVEHWQDLWDGAYRQSDVAEPRFNTAGWTDSATGELIPREQMREWIDGVATSILALKPKRVLEIGCGTGMVLYRVMPHVEHYAAVDLSPHVLATIRGELSSEELPRVTLLQQPAHALEGVGVCDTVVINSVAQYFPDAAYLEKVLRRASDLVSDGGRIFVGDVRSFDHLEAFHTDVALKQAPAHLSAEELKQRVARRIAQEGELTVSEAFFHGLMRAVPRITHVEARLKPGAAHNEMTLFRYDVVLHVGASAGGVTPVALDLAGAKAAMARGEPAIMVRDLVNARLAGLAAATKAISAGANAAAARALLDVVPADAIDPAALASLHPDYIAEIVWARSGGAAKMDVVFRHRSVPNVVIPAPAPDKPLGAYANMPARGQVEADLFEELRAHVREFLPEFMTPSVFVAMKAFPLTPNGKIDRKALPAPVQASAVADAAYVPPSSGTEEVIAGVWKALLGLDRVGRRDNIFDLGANSLLTVQANQRLSTLLNRRISLVSMFRFPTVEALAAHLDEAQAPAATPAKVDEREARKQDAAQRRRQMRAGGS